MTLTQVAMSLDPNVYFVGTGILLFSLACVSHVTTAAISAPSAPTAIVEDEERHIWEEGAMEHLYWWMDCNQFHNERALEVHNATVWNLLQDTYRDVVHQDLSSLPPRSSESLKGYQVPVQVKRTHVEDNEELGVFSKQAIPKGTLVFQSTNTAQFRSGQDFRRFLKSLPENLACDVLDWAYPRFHKDESPLVCVDLDHGSLTNSCDSETDECNMGMHSEQLESEGCELTFYATRDIAAGEELKISHNWDAHGAAYVPLGLAHPLEYHLEDYEEGEEGEYYYEEEYDEDEHEF